MHYHQLLYNHMLNLILFEAVQNEKTIQGTYCSIIEIFYFIVETED